MTRRLGSPGLVPQRACLGLLLWLGLLRVWTLHGPLWRHSFPCIITSTQAISHQPIPTARHNPGEKFGPPTPEERAARPYCLQTSLWDGRCDRSHLWKVQAAPQSYRGEEGRDQGPHSFLLQTSRPWEGAGTWLSRPPGLLLLPGHTHSPFVFALDMFCSAFLCSLDQMKKVHLLFIPVTSQMHTISAQWSFKTKMRIKIGFYFLNESKVALSIVKGMVSFMPCMASATP